jgi:serpin B
MEKLIACCSLNGAEYKARIATLAIFFFACLSTHAQTDKLTKSLNDYSFELYGQVKHEHDNLFFSPLSTYYALLIAYEGAQNETKIAFEKVLHIDNPKSLSSFKDFTHNLTTPGDSTNYLRLANAIWVQNNFSLKKDYQDKIIQRYSSDLRTIDFKQKTSATHQINNWVSDNTNGLIKEIISPADIDDSTRLVISNAIYFIGKWEDKFEKNHTKPDDFYSINKDKVLVDFMNKTENLWYYENNDFQFIAKPYKNNDKSFCVILPKDRYGLIEVEKVLSSSTLEIIFNNTEFLEVELSIPKLKLESGFSLVEPLKKLGLEIAFTRDADFSGITAEVPLLIDQVNHKAFIAMDEEQTEAAASTIIVMKTGAAPKPMLIPKIFKADHPFIFMIIDNRKNGIIFIGRYAKP